MSEFFRKIDFRRRHVLKYEFCDIFGGQKRQGWGSTVGDPKKQHKQQQKQHKTAAKEAAKAATAAAQTESKSSTNYRRTKFKHLVTGASHDNQRTAKCAQLSAPALQTPPKFHEKDPQRGKKRTNFVAGEGKKRAKFWARKGGPGEGRSRATELDQTKTLKPTPTVKPTPTPHNTHTHKHSQTLTNTQHTHNTHNTSRTRFGQNR